LAAKAALDKAGPVWPVLAILKTGAEPLWFEFTGPESSLSGLPVAPETIGLGLIPSPGDASLIDYAPWPHARFSAGMLVSGNRGTVVPYLVLAINRAGFLIAAPGPEEGTVVLYQAADPLYWAPYTVASLFEYEDTPAVLLYRDTFFPPGTSDGNSDSPAPVPEHQVFTLTEGSPKPRHTLIPALEMFSKEEGWELNALRQGPDRYWYYRSVQTGDAPQEPAHYRTPDLSQPGVQISPEDFRNAFRPQDVTHAPPFIGLLLTAAEECVPGLSGIPLLRVISPDFSSPRFFSRSSDTEGEFALCFGFYRDASRDAVRGAVAFTVFPNGQGLAFKDSSALPSALPKILTFSLPPLPEGFVYTAAGLVGNTFIASWEEQDEYAIGAAGFMALSMESLGL
jgi:hypothetical protein